MRCGFGARSVRRGRSISCSRIGMAASRRCRICASGYSCPFKTSCCITIDGEPTSAAKYGFHALRHAAASLFIAHLGWTPKRVQTVMGHSSIRMTYDLYGHLFEDPEADREAMKKIEAAVVAA